MEFVSMCCNTWNAVYAAALIIGQQYIMCSLTALAAL